MEINELEARIQMLKDKNNTVAFKALQELEQISDETGALYGYTGEFADMIGSENYGVRVRGFRLFCRQAKWDKDNVIDENIDAALRILKDDKPTAVRQALAALADVVRFKPDLRETVRSAVSNINYLRYKDTMHSLIAKDIQELLFMIQALELGNGV